MAFKVPENKRWLAHEIQLARRHFKGELIGSFLLTVDGAKLLCIVSDSVDAVAAGLPPWDHVSVSVPGKKRCPTWPEMAYAKSQFWDKDDCVIQFHPPESQYINNHEYVLHLWRPVGIEVPMPASIMVGIPGGVLTEVEAKAVREAMQESG